MMKPDSHPLRHKRLLFTQFTFVRTNTMTRYFSFRWLLTFYRN